MSNRFFEYLEREHARLDAAIQHEQAKLRPDGIEIARLKRLKLAVKDQLTAWRRDEIGAVA
ncbi:DUF465 domain-containing protein [Sphingomonas sp. MAH-20]|jgi:hypothetical protein|uniref:DUF465 domain-containing protein n=1 Tax=Sphingomonas horti TaxID=2682842 RepID=A0A6I4J308_9SPHN|nr:MULTISPECIES: YdcH family protein [Sphingomonas]MBA2918782.1 YdcH family protein [Sphingomonas sp. CGMCC 1.13658]MVO78815.1 DUF465 domain-containing protein [Sphingomonas horti]